MIELAVVAVFVAVIASTFILGPHEDSARNLQVGGVAVLILTLLLPIAGIAAAVLGVLLIIRQQVGRGVLLLACSIVVAGLAGAFWYSVLITEEPYEPTELVAPEVDPPGTPPEDEYVEPLPPESSPTDEYLECVDPVSYEFIC